MDDFIKQLRSGRHNNQLIETLGGCQHYVSNLKSADIIEQLEFRDKQSREDMVTMASVNSTLYAKIEQLEASIIHAKWVSAMATIEQLQEDRDKLDDLLVDAQEEVEQLGVRVEELEGLIDNIYNSDCNLATASIIAANLIPPQQEKDGV